MAKLPPPPFFTLRGHEDVITALHFTEEIDDGISSKPSLISGSQTGEIFIWNLKTFRTYHRFEGHDKKSILFLNYYQSSLLSQGRDGFLNIWKFLDQQWIVTRKFKSLSVGFCPSILHFNNIVLFNDKAHELRFYNFENESMYEKLKMENCVGMCMRIKAIQIKGKTFILAGYESGDVGLWNCESLQEIYRLNLRKEPVMCLDYDSECKNRGISGSVDKCLETWTITENLEIGNVKRIDISNPGITDVKIREDKKIVITAGTDCNIRVFSWKSMKLLAVLDFHRSPIYCVSFCSESVGKRNSVFASGSVDKCIALWSLY
ncbi:guanine nucleotide-binding protein subunit beta-like protein 1 [Trichonephila inaurata madagascariensis]|uniref:Guanine nucleotide-binding protein subunit beta-like protein 1 n=1 Tax=Trichonephila inaurata madagascariensis TaxID=2747483 RepID=A0A8X7C518_9ARAC|nr:guanine nucleotide-binding protein subunit beta-like protein 1 [Trichonephila inaurata madagascariensis]